MMKLTKNIYYVLGLSLLMVAAGCSDDDNAVITEPAPMANAGADQTVDLEKTVTLDASASTGESVTYAWEVLDPSGNTVSLEDAATAMPSFVASAEGMYNATLTLSNSGGSESASSVVTVENPTYSSSDQMGRPGINTVFNFFGSAEVKNGYNMTTPEGGNAATADFKGIFDALQTYIGLDASTYTNVLGLDNETTASVLATDVLMSNKDFPSTYGPSDLNNITVGANVLNGRTLAEDVIDVTLILTFAGDDLSDLNSTQMGLISDNVDSNDKEFASTFPYLAAPH